MEWQLQEAKNKLSQVVDKALAEGPQQITRHGKPTAVLLSMKDFGRMQKKTGSLADFFRHSPLEGLNLKRNRDFGRQVEL